MLTDEQKQRVEAMWLAGKSAGLIELEISELGVTRNAIIGHIFRRKMQRPASTMTLPPGGFSRQPAPAAKPAQSFKRAQTPAPKPFVRRAPARAEKQATPGPEAIPYVPGEAAWFPLPTSTPVAFLDHRHGMCRWPLGDSLDLAVFRFCGAVSGDAIYCAPHAEIAKGRGTKSERAAA